MTCARHVNLSCQSHIGAVTFTFCPLTSLYAECPVGNCQQDILNIKELMSVFQLRDSSLMSNSSSYELISSRLVQCFNNNTTITITAATKATAAILFYHQGHCQCCPCHVDNNKNSNSKLFSSWTHLTNVSSMGHG